jgi:L-lactate utilization protein LutB
MDMDRSWLWEKMAERTVDALKRHGFEAFYAKDANEARAMALEIISQYGTIGVGGSNTVRALGLVDDLKQMGKTVYDHWIKGLSKEEELDIRLAQGRSDCFVTSANAISETGEIVNVDGIGNRVAAMTFGPKRVIVIAGMNKVRPDLDSALKRVKEVAGPMRARSLNMKTPCAETGVCNDCNSPQRICRITTILHRRPSLTQVTVILVGEELGF